MMKLWAKIALLTGLWAACLIGTAAFAEKQAGTLQYQTIPEYCYAEGGTLAKTCFPQTNSDGEVFWMGWSSPATKEVHMGENQPLPTTKGKYKFFFGLRESANYSSNLYNVDMIYLGVKTASVPTGAALDNIYYRHESVYSGEAQTIAIVEPYLAFDGHYPANTDNMYSVYSQTGGTVLEVSATDASGRSFPVEHFSMPDVSQTYGLNFRVTVRDAGVYTLSVLSSETGEETLWDYTGASPQQIRIQQLCRSTAEFTIRKAERTAGITNTQPLVMDYDGVSSVAALLCPYATGLDVPDYTVAITDAASGAAADGIAVGNYRITVSYPETRNYLAAGFTVEARVNAVLERIGVEFAQGTKVIYEGETPEALRPLLSVYGVNNDGSRVENITDYELSGALTAGQSTITVRYGGKTASFTVQVTAMPPEIILAHNELLLCPGDRQTLTLRLLHAEAAEIRWTSADMRIATVDGDGSVTALLPGTTVITAQLAEMPEIAATCRLVVAELDSLLLPADLTEIREEAFAGLSIERVVAGSRLTTIGAGAFRNCTRLKLVELPASVQSIAADAFAGCTNVILVCPSGSPAAAYAAEKGMTCYIRETRS